MKSIMQQIEKVVDIICSNAGTGIASHRTHDVHPVYYFDLRWLEEVGETRLYFCRKAKDDAYTCMEILLAVEGQDTDTVMAPKCVWPFKPQLMLSYLRKFAKYLCEKLEDDACGMMLVE